MRVQRDVGDPSADSADDVRVRGLGEHGHPESRRGPTARHDGRHRSATARLRHRGSRGSASAPHGLLGGHRPGDPGAIFEPWLGVAAESEPSNRRSRSFSDVTAPAPRRLYLVYADWCPHCVPLSTDRAPPLADRLGIPLVQLDIDDPEQERQADALVEVFGDWTPDYLIPQLFLERSDGTVEHLLTGIPGSPSTGTKSAWDRVYERFGVPAAD